jgi:hypothetical protein
MQQSDEMLNAGKDVEAMKRLSYCLIAFCSIASLLLVPIFYGGCVITHIY